MKRWLTPLNISLAALLVFIAFVLLPPNPLGNNPDIIGDESYFLTSALSSLEKVTPAGLVFTQEGNYYGGPQTYIDTVVMAPVLGVLFVENHFSVFNTEMQIALHTGDLLSILRFVTGVLVLVFCGFFFVFFAKKKIPRQLALQFLLLFFFLLGNSLIAGFVHTAKVWTFYLLLDVGIGALFIANEYYLSRLGKPFIEKNIYVAFIVWAGILAFFQNYVGAFSIILWLCYALVLKHIEIRDIWNYVLKYWYWIVAFSVLQLSFLYRAAFVRNHATWWDPGDISTKTTTLGIDWFHRLYNPLAFAVESQPLVVLYLVGLITALCLLIWKRSYFKESRKRIYTAIACLHPVFVYIIFYLGFGFSIFPRYSLMMTVAFTFSAVMLLAEVDALLWIGLVLSGLLFLVVNVHSVMLYWKPSSEVVLTKELATHFTSPSDVIILEPDAWRLALPVNEMSLSLLNTRHQTMIRYAFLQQRSTTLDSWVSFKPTVLMSDNDAEAAAYQTSYASSTDSVWTITTSCTNLCSTVEIGAGSCFMVNEEACGITPQEINTLSDFLSVNQLGSAYVVRKVH
jgi:hypothetical protein